MSRIVLIACVLSTLLLSTDSLAGDTIVPKDSIEDSLSAPLTGNNGRVWYFWCDQTYTSGTAFNTRADPTVTHENYRSLQRQHCHFS